MKRILLATTIACLIATGYFWRQASQPLELTLASATASDSAGAGANGNTNAKAIAIDFPEFPLDRTVTITFDTFEGEAGNTDAVAFRQASVWNGYSQKSTGHRERHDQWRDWLLFTVVMNSTLPPEHINLALFDVLPRRLGLFQNLGGFEYGSTRSRIVGTDEVIALVPRGTPAEQQKRLAHVADEQRKNLGAIPSSFHVFEYTLNDDHGSATIIRRQSIPGPRLFDAAAGYHEVTVDSLDDLQRFMRSANDLTFAKFDGGRLTLGGRHVAGYRGIAVEDVAALWQSEQDLEAERSGSGFSLDPQIDKEALGQHADGFVELLDRIAGVRAITLFDGDELRAELRRGEVGGYLEAAAKVCAGTDAAARCNSIIRQRLLENRFQKARYDGKLQGTEVGMVLFYTDLLMKLWAQNRRGSTPDASEVPDFPNRLEMDVARVFAKEVDQIPETRLWLGSLDSGFQITSSRDAIVWARKATRVFAVPHSSLEDRDDPTATEPHIYNRVLVTWWNQHYEEVADYEPEYQRLNEIMKWSQLAGWVNTSSRQFALAFLLPVPVTRTHWFPEWVQHHPELTFTEWSSIGFGPRGAHEVDTETMPVLRSDPFVHFGREMTWGGGVSLARREAIAQRPVLDAAVSPLARRGNVDYSATNLASGRLRTLEKVNYEFAKAARGQASTVARPDASARLRSLIGEFKNTHLERTYVRDSTRSVVSMRTGEARFGELRIRNTPDGVRVMWTSRDVDAAQVLGRRVSASTDRHATLLQDASVEAAIPLDVPDSYLVKIRGTDGWVKLTASADDSSSLTAGTHARVSGPGRNARPVDLTWIDDANVGAQMKSDTFVEIPTRVSADRGMNLRIAARPPPTARQLEASHAGERLNVFVDDASNTKFVRWADLPQDLRRSPGKLQRLGTDTLDARPADELATLLDGRASNFDGMAGRIAQDPTSVRRAVDRGLEEQLRTYDLLRARQEFAEAQRQLHDLLAVYAERPEVLSRSALYDLSKGRAEPAAQLASKVESSSARQRQVFLDEINRRIEVSAGVEQQNLEQLRAYLAWTEKQAGAAPNGSRIAVTPNGEQVVFEYHVNGVQYRPATALDLERSPAAALYIEDSPGLNNIDVSTVFGRQAVETGVLNGRLTIAQLSMDDVGRYRPAIIQAAGASAHRLRLVTGAGRSALSSQSGGGPCNGTDPSRPDCTAVYVVRPATALPPGM